MVDGLRAGEYICCTAHNKKSEEVLILALVEAIGFGVLILAWCKADSRESGEELTGGWTFMLVAFGVLALAAYLFKSRGFGKGLISLLYAAGFWIGMTVANFVVGFATLMILAMMGVDIKRFILK